MTDSLKHVWIVAPYKRDQEEAWEKRVKHYDVCYTIDCHRTKGGPYSGTGALLRTIVPQIHKQHPHLLTKHAIEILSIAPDLQSFVPPPLGTLTSLAVPQERTRFYAGDRTRRLAHGIVELLLDYVCLEKITCFELFFSRVDKADPLDQEFIAILLRRTRDQPLLIVVGTTTEQPVELISHAVKNFAQLLTVPPLTLEERSALLCSYNIPASWQHWLMQQPVSWRGAWEALFRFPALLTREPPEESNFEQGIRAILLQCSQEMREHIARSYVERDGDSENPVEQVAYQLLAATIRQKMHDERVAILEKLNHQWQLLGPIVYHYERGSDSAVKGAKALSDSINYSFDMGYYEASLDYGMRGRHVVDRETQLGLYWNFTTKVITSFLVLERPDEAEKYCKEMRECTNPASIQIQLAYTTAMLYTRYFKDQRRDHHLAREWIQIALTLTYNMQEASEEERAFMTVFNMNALALIEMNLGNPENALRLIADGLAQMNRDLGPDAYQLHRSVFLYNRGQVYARMKQYELALAAFTEVIRHDPYYSEYYFDRADIYQRLHRYEEAWAD